MNFARGRVAVLFKITNFVVSRKRILHIPLQMTGPDIQDKFHLNNNHYK